MHGSRKHVGYERHGIRVWCLRTLSFFDANQMAPTAHGNGGPPEYMGSRMTWLSERDLRTLCIFGNIKWTAPIATRKNSRKV